MSQSNINKGKAHAEKLKSFLDKCRSGLETPPIRNGLLNKTKVAEVCGFRRGVFVENEECKTLIEKAVKEFSQRSVQDNETGVKNEEFKRLERKVQRLERQVADLLVENAALRSNQTRKLFAESWFEKTGWIIGEEDAVS